METNLINSADRCKHGNNREKSMVQLRSEKEEKKKLRRKIESDDTNDTRNFQFIIMINP